MPAEPNQPAVCTGDGKPTPDGPQVVLKRGTVDDVDALESLWLSVHHHHQASMPQLAPYIIDEDSWSIRSGLYRTLLTAPDSVLLLAYDGPDLVGYGLAHVTETADTWIADTWQRGPRTGEIESLAVLPAYRGRRIGTEPTYSTRCTARWPPTGSTM